MNDIIYKNMQKHNKSLSKYATSDSSATYLKEMVSDIRTPFFRDIDKIIYSLAYVRYMDKTQVFTKEKNDHIQKRMIHVQYVSKIARTIGRALNLNEDLIEAGALGHDLGHTPFGHVGEEILNRISLEAGEGYFMHNINSVRNLMYIENHGEGLNISVEVLDAIMCHNGEIVSGKYEPMKKTKEEFLNEYKNSYHDKNVAKYLRPMTLEGCVVRISDIIAYLGRDIEDAIRLNLVTFDDIPSNITSVLGKSNSEIVNTIILDIIKNSEDKDYICLSDNVFNAINELKKYNYENIYLKAYSDDEGTNIESMFKTLFNESVKDIKTNNLDSMIYKTYLKDMNDLYKQNTPERIALDYIAGMTDEFFINECKRLNINY